MSTTADTSEVRNALERRAASPQESSVHELIERQRPQIERLVRDSGAADRLARIALTELRRTPALYDCSPASLLGALMLSAQLGLEPGPLGHVYLVPMGREVVWMLGYTGIIELARDGGVEDLHAELVWNCDEYVKPWRNERGVHYELRPGDDDAREERVAVLVTWTAGRKAMALHVPPSRIERARKASKTAHRADSFWNTDTDAAWRKTGVRMARPFLPLTPRAARALNADEAPATPVDDAVEVVDAAPEVEA